MDLDSVIQSSDEYQNGKRILNQRKKRGAYYLPEYITGARTLRVNLFENAQFIYQIMMVESLSRFKSYDGALLEYLSAYIQTALARLIDSRVEIGHRLDRILSDILSNPGRDNKSAENGFGIRLAGDASLFLCQPEGQFPGLGQYDRPIHLQTHGKYAGKMWKLRLPV